MFEHRDFRADVLNKYDLDGEELRKQSTDYSNWGANMKEEGATKMLQIGFDHGVKLYANALGVPPEWMLDLCKQNNVPVAALAKAATGTLFCLHRSSIHSGGTPNAFAYSFTP